MSMSMESETRMPQRTAQESPDRRIASDTARRVQGAASAPMELRRRLEALDREWDMDRALHANAGILAGLGGVLALTVNRRFAMLPALVGGFLVQHALQGWCPPVPFLRRAGLRTSREIAAERMALKALRGDFDHVAESKDPGQRAQAALRAAEERG